MCAKVMAGLLAQMHADGRIQDGCVGSVLPEEEIAMAWDDQTGEELDPHMVRQARNEEMHEVDKHQLYLKVPIQECWDKTGKAPTKTRWIDINKGDDEYEE